MLIESQNADYLNTIPQGIVSKIRQAVALMDYADNEVTLTIIDRKPKRQGVQECISLIRHDNELMFVVELQQQGHTSAYTCRLDFARKATDGGLMGRLLWTRLERTIKELQNGRTPPTPEQLTASAVVHPPERKFNPSFFTKSSEQINTVITYLRRKYGDGPHTIVLIKDVLRECLDNVQAPGRIIGTLQTRGWLLDTGSGTFMLVPQGKEPQDALTAPTRPKASTSQTLPDDPALARLAAVSDLMKGQSSKRTALTHKEARLKKMQDERLLLDAQILSLETEIRQEKKLLLTPEKLKQLDAALKGLGIELPGDGEAT